MADALLAARRKIRRLLARSTKAFNAPADTRRPRVRERTVHRFTEKFWALDRRIEKLRKKRGITRAEAWWRRVVDPFILAMHGSAVEAQVAFVGQKRVGPTKWQEAKVVNVGRTTFVDKPRCKGTLHVTPGSGSGWVVILCTHCDFHVEQ